MQDTIDGLRRKTPDALAMARAAVEAAPQNAGAHHLLGVAQLEAGDAVGARASFELAVVLAPDEPIYHFSLARMAYAERDFAAANRAVAHAIALDPNQIGAYLLRIQLAIADGDLVEAERQLRLAERVDPERPHPQLLYASGQIALLKGDDARAIGLLNQAAAAQPGDAQIFATLGFAYRRQGHSAFAEQAVRRAMELDPGETGWRQLLIEALVDQNRHDDAEAELDRYLQQRPEDPGSLLLKARMRVRMGRSAEAVTDFRDVLRRWPRDLGAIAGLEDALAGFADPRLVRDMWETILLDDPGFDQAWAVRLAAALDEDDQDAVLRRWREALPESAAALLCQARRDEVLGRESEAEAGYDAILVREPMQFDAGAAKAAIELARDPAASIERLEPLILQAAKPQAGAALAMRGLAYDQLQQPHLAIADWQQVRAGFGVDPPNLPMPPKEAGALVAGLPAASGHPVVMLWGPPGSSVERLAAALRQSSGLQFLQATGNAPRTPHYPEPFLARALNPAGLPGVVAEVAPVYARMLEPHLAQGQRSVIDWLAQWDSRVAPVLRHALPGTRLIAVLRDPRDMLLHWLAFGTPANLRLGDPVAAATWLGGQVEHLLFSRDALHLPVLAIDMDRFDAQPAETMQAIADFVSLPTSPDPQPALLPRVGMGRLPALLPAGRWRAYRDELVAAFALLAPLAERLGYPRE